MIWGTENVNREANKFHILNTLPSHDGGHVPMLSLSGVRTTEMVISEAGSPSDTCIKAPSYLVLVTARQMFWKGDRLIQLVVCPQVEMKLVPEIEPKWTVTWWFNSFLIKRTLRSYKASGFTTTCHTCIECSLWSHSTHYPVPSSFCLHIRQSSTISHALSLPPKFIYEGKGA